MELTEITQKLMQHTKLGLTLPIIQINNHNLPVLTVEGEWQNISCNKSQVFQWIILSVWISQDLPIPLIRWGVLILLYKQPLMTTNIQLMEKKTIHVD